MAPVAGDDGYSVYGMERVYKIVMCHFSENLFKEKIIGI
jgi:hypothetical protein